MASPSEELALEPSSDSSTRAELAAAPMVGWPGGGYLWHAPHESSLELQAGKSGRRSGARGAKSRVDTKDTNELR